MQPIKDIIGNAIEEGKLVRVNSQNKEFFGEVAKVNAGGVMLAGGPSPAMVTVIITLQIPTRPGSSIPDLLVVERPDSKKGPSIV